MRKIIVTILAILASIYLVNFFLYQNVKGDSKFDGNYKFIKEELSIKNPKSETRIRTSDGWDGLWIFHDGTFGVTMMNLTRNDWFVDFPKNEKELGFESFSGTFSIKESRLNIKKNLDIDPFQVKRIREFTIEYEGSNLVLVENLVPSRHSAWVGTRKVYLAKISSDVEK
jgi:hypothetical protein